MKKEIMESIKFLGMILLVCFIIWAAIEKYAREWGGYRNLFAYLFFAIFFACIIKVLLLVLRFPNISRFLSLVIIVFCVIVGFLALPGVVILGLIDTFNDVKKR